MRFPSAAPTSFTPLRYHHLVTVPTQNCYFKSVASLPQEISINGEITNFGFIPIDHNTMLLFGCVCVCFSFVCFISFSCFP